MPSKKNVEPKITDIDLSSIKNIDAVKQMEPDFEESIQKKITSKSRKSKFQFTEPELIPLPSRGILYTNNTEDEDILKGYIRVYPMTVKEEEILSTSRFIRSGSVTRMILDRVIASNISAKDILLFDSNFLMFYLRKVSYGDDYKFTLTCRNQACTKKFQHTVKISQIEFEELPDVVEPIEVKLPSSKYTVRSILPRLYHSEDIVAKNSNRKKNSDSEDKGLLDNLVVTTREIISPNGDIVPKQDWEEFFEAIIGIDRSALRDATSFNTGVDTLKNVVCPYCEEDYEGTIPIGTEFFRFK